MSPNVEVRILEPGISDVAGPVREPKRPSSERAIRGDHPTSTHFAMVTLVMGLDVRTDDRVGLAANWGRPPQADGRDQVSYEAWYRVQLTDHIQLSPGAQWTFQPAYEPDRDWTWVVSAVRLRVVF